MIKNSAGRAWFSLCCTNAAARHTFSTNTVSNCLSKSVIQTPPKCKCSWTQMKRNANSFKAADIFNNHQLISLYINLEMIAVYHHCSGKCQLSVKVWQRNDVMHSHRAVSPSNNHKQWQLGLHDIGKNVGRNVCCFCGRYYDSRLPLHLVWKLTKQQKLECTGELQKTCQCQLKNQVYPLPGWKLIKQCSYCMGAYRKQLWSNPIF